MKRILIVILIAAVLPAASNAQNFRKLLKEKTQSLFSDDNVTLGLKQALEFGVSEAVDHLSAPNGYLDSPYKILVPDEAQQVVNKLKFVPGFENVERDLIAKMNEAAEHAAKEATPIFLSAITNMNFDDAMDILTGGNDAATRYLESSTRDQLYDSFIPVIQNALDEVNAREYWAQAVEKYNKIPFVKKVNPELDDHVTDKALDGLFGEIQLKEEKIRGDKDERTTDLLKEVFAQQDQ